MGTGKTTRADIIYNDCLVSGIPALNIDYDKVANDVVSEEFGITTPQQRLQIADKLFNNRDELAAFEAIVHPKTYLKCASKVEEFVNEHKSANLDIIIIIHQIPLYNRTKTLFIKHFGVPNEVITLTASDDEIIRRLTAQRGLNKAQIMLRLKNQQDI